ncbi:hypothetical protein EV198_2856 [Roseivirga ehrenbergii]|uniref:ApeA N-terminal domain-containing protein n=1 Tax=Roseivirga ehrenbergii (strain DSM 102268 / JCM 13514 / KCTC 12282 / NCIMB 14502 / KMM 6017) TaxID=279360 RepID=A0A150XQE8_ROSEK|nr:hypothetical protein [Roseivirga ehrenbergii]KYG80978.1 hypothetical protein MB14_14435 [Roseivirga ehrenbergii]TCL00840.1 hypothetical protein EV198_2856 [Roseivirga ehrenbergii]
MERIEDIKKNAIQTNLNKTFEFLRRFNRSKKGTIISQYPTINGIDISFKRTYRKFLYETSEILSKGPPVKFQHLGYRMIKPFKIQSNDELYDVKYGACHVSTNIGSGFNSKGELCELDWNFDESKGYYRALLPLSEFSHPPVNYILGSAFKVGRSTRYHGYIPVSLGSHKLAFYDYDYKKQRYLVVDSLTSMDYPEFEKAVEAIIYSFGFLSGSLTRDELTIFSHSESSFKKVSGFQFRQTEDTIRSSLGIINPREHKEYDNLDKAIYFSEEDFSKLATVCFNELPFKRAIRIITQSRNLPQEIETASFFVALETIKNLIITSNEEKIRSFKNQEDANKLILDCKALVNKLDDSKLNFKQRVLNKMDQLNDIGNNESFLISFDLMGLKLNKAEKQCIKKRNRFLHGNMPFENEPESVKTKELSEIALRTHYLVSSLILKYAGCSCYLKNTLKYLDLANGENKVDEPLFKKI